MFGFLNINKPEGLTSHDVVAKLRKLCKIKQIGHTGTLDPLATGVLPIAIGKATRLIEYLDDDKAYVVKLLLGKVSDTFDIDGNVETFSDKQVSLLELTDALQNFRGTIEQIPPVFSAVHYNGKRLYELARQGIIPDDIPKRVVEIFNLDLLNFDINNKIVELKIHCSSGTYIRSIVNDLGMLLGTGAIMIELKRVKAGAFDIVNSIDLSFCTSLECIHSNLIQPNEILKFSKINLNVEQFSMVKNGRGFSFDCISDGAFYSLIFDNKLCAIAQGGDKNKLDIKKVFIQ